MATALRAVPTGSAAGTDPLAPDLLAGCAAELATRHADLVAALHRRLLELAPWASRLEGGGQPMCHRLVSAVLAAADPVLPAPQAVALVQRVGAENYLEGFPPGQYGPVTHALLNGVRRVFPGEWSGALSSAWVEFLMSLRPHLLAGAEAQRAHQEGGGNAYR